VVARPGHGAEKDVGAVSASSGVFAILFTDLVGSTELMDHLGDDAAEELRQQHFAILRGACSQTNGREVKNLGDGIMVSFASPVEAVRCAVAVQRSIAAHNRKQPDPGLKVRVGLHAGEPFCREEDFFGTAVAVAKRLCDQAQGGQILASELVRGLVGSRGGFIFRSVGRLRLKGLADPVASVVVDWEPSPGTPQRRPVAPNRPRPRPPRPRGPRLVGRERELAVLETELERARAGELRCVLVSGDPGVGKTRLAAELLDRHAAEVTGLTVRAYPLAATTAFGLWAEALEPFFRGVDADEVFRLCGGFVDDLGSLLHSVAAARGTVPGRDPPRLRLLEGLLRVLDNLARDAPLVVVLDDVHLADASSWEALRYVARHLSEARLLLLATARPSELAGQDLAAQVLFELDQDGVLTQLDLVPLARQGVHQLAEVLLGRRPPAALVDWLVERSCGNALFAIGLLRALLEEDADLTSPRLERLPESLTQRVVGRTKLLDDPQRSTLELLAVLGRQIEFNNLVRLSGQPAEQLGRILAALVAARAVVEEERGRELTYEIHHPLVRDAIYQAIGGARRRVLHRQLARDLLQVDRLTEAAPHFARSAEVGDPEAIETLLDAMRQAEQREAYHEALELLSALVELLPPGNEHWLQVLEAMSTGAEWVVDHRADAHGLTTIKAMRAIDALLEDSPDAARRAAVKFRLANFLAWGTGQLEEAHRVCLQARQLFAEAGDHRSTLLAARELAWIRGLQGDLASMAVDGRSVVEAAEAAGERFVVMQGLMTIGYAAVFLGRFDEVEAVLRRAMTIAREDGKVYRLTVILGVLAASRCFQGRTDEGLALLEEAKRLNPGYRDSILVELETQHHWGAGNFRAAVGAAREAMAWNPAGTSRRRAFAMALGAVSAAETGEVAEAEQFLARARAALGGQDWSVFIPLCTYADGVLAWHRGRQRESVGMLRQAAARLREMNARLYLGDVLLDLTEVAAENADVGGATAAAGELGELARQLDRERYWGLAAISSAWANIATDDLPGAVRSARVAVEYLSGTGCRGIIGRAFDVLGRSLARSDRAEAIRALQQALSAFEDVGAARRKDRSLEVLRGLGGAGRRRAAAAMGPSSLSRREREVARLAAGGLSAREIAERLFVSERTVETHLTHIYAKLGVDSKLDLVRRAPGLVL